MNTCRRKWEWANTYPNYYRQASKSNYAALRLLYDTHQEEKYRRRFATPVVARLALLIPLT